jgi:anti-sigma factor RsiW
MTDLACRDLVELVTAYLDGALPPAEAAAVDAHLAGCAGCRHYLDQIRVTVTALGRVPVQDLPDDVYARLHAAFTRGAG